MRLRTKQIFPILLLLTTLSNTFSQSTYNIHIGPSLPLTEFGLYPISRGSGDYYSNASIGIDVGLQYSYQFSEKGFGFFAAFDFIFNDVNKDFKDQTKDIEEDFGLTLIKLPVYYNLPLSAGLSYKYQASNSVSLYCSSGMTFNFMKVADYEWEHATFERDWSTSIGFRIGVGVLFKERYSLGVNYLGLGKHDSVGREIPDEYSHGDETDELNIHLLTITAGWNF